MIKMNGIDSFKFLAEMQVNLIPGGAIYVIVEGETITWKLPSKVFDLDVFNPGNKVSAQGASMRAIKENRTVTDKIPRSVYGRRLTITSTPIVNEDGEAVGAASVVFPKLHPVASAFDKFAPVLAEMFAEGGFLYMSDLQKIAYRQPSKKFDMPSLPVGYDLKEGDAALQAISTKRPVSKEVDASRFGVPISATCVPLFDEDDPDEVVATLGIILPKATAVQLRDMSENMGNGLTSISAAIEQLAASAGQIHTNEQELNKGIKEVFRLSEDINDILVFIKEIAEQTKMLGLNAAIEAARAGEAGRGFGVVAEEIRKLSDESKSTVPKIRKITDDIKEKITAASQKSNESMQSSQEQAAATEEITASIQEITGMAEELSKVAKEL